MDHAILNFSFLVHERNSVISEMGNWGIDILADNAQYLPLLVSNSHTISGSQTFIQFNELLFLSFQFKNGYSKFTSKCEWIYESKNLKENLRIS